MISVSKVLKKLLYSDFVISFIALQKSADEK